MWRNKEVIVIVTILVLIGGSLVAYFAIFSWKSDTSATENAFTMKGTVSFIDMEGGFYGIIADDGEHYDPINLPPQFKLNGLRVWFRAEICENQLSFHMWGTRIEIIEIKIILA